MTIGTFHSICLTLLRGELGVRRLADPYEQRALAASVLAGLGRKDSPWKLLQTVSRAKTSGRPTEEAAVERTLTICCWRPSPAGKGGGRTRASPTCWWMNFRISIPCNTA